MEADLSMGWEKLKRALHSSSNPFLKLHMLTQDGSVVEHMEEFEILAAQIPLMSNE